MIKKANVLRLVPPTIWAQFAAAALPVVVSQLNNGGNPDASLADSDVAELAGHAADALAVEFVNRFFGELK